MLLKWVENGDGENCTPMRADGQTGSFAPLGVDRAIRVPLNMRRRSIFDPYAFAENRLGRNPTVNTPAVVSNLKPVALNSLNQVDVLEAVDLAQHNVPDFECRAFGGFNGAELAALDLA